MEGGRCGSAAFYARMRDCGWRITTRAKLMQCWRFRSIGFHWSDQLDLDFILDHLQPLFGSRGAALNMFDFEGTPHAVRVIHYKLFSDDVAI
jgi:hypothetical protein